MSRVNEIRYVGYGVEDFDAERKFYGEIWGLREVACDGGLAYFAAEGSPEKYVVRLRRADVRRVDVIAWATASRADVDALFEKVKAAGSPIVAEPHALDSPGGGYGFRFFDPDGHTIEISSDVERGPVRDVGPKESIPVRISHVVLHSPDHHRMVKYYTEVLGFRVSDWLGDFMCFLRCNEWHHRLALLPGPPCLNHVAYDVPGIDALMRGIGRLKKLQVQLCWGPGRHTAGNNTFSYFATPSKFAVEYTSDLERVDEATWQPKVYDPKPDIMDQWGSGVGGPHAMPRPEADKGLHQAPPV